MTKLPEESAYPGGVAHLLKKTGSQLGNAARPLPIARESGLFF